MPIDDAYAAYLKEIGALGTDEGGRHVLVGLTSEETEDYLRYLDERACDETSPLNYQISPDRFLELEAKHERTRVEILASDSRTQH